MNVRGRVRDKHLPEAEDYRKVEDIVSANSNIR